MEAGIEWNAKYVIAGLGRVPAQARSDEIKCRTILRPGLAVIINPSRRNIRMPQPFLNLGNIGLMIQSIGCRGRAQSVRPDFKT